jgi:hypothetical protein
MAIVVEGNVRPSVDELEAAVALSDYLGAPVTFCKPSNTAKSPDLLIAGQYWEIKTPTGSGKNTIRHQISRAKKQSSRIIINANHTKIQYSRIVSELSNIVGKYSPLNEVLVLGANGSIERIK